MSEYQERVPRKTFNTSFSSESGEEDFRIKIADYQLFDFSVSQKTQILHKSLRRSFLYLMSILLGGLVIDKEYRFSSN